MVVISTNALWPASASLPLEGDYFVIRLSMEHSLSALSVCAMSGETREPPGWAALVCASD
jgi:hypothetical protein